MSDEYSANNVSTKAVPIHKPQKIALHNVVANCGKEISRGLMV